MNKRIVFDNLNDIQGKNKGEEFKDMLKDSGVILHENDNYADDNNFYGGALEDDIDETVAVTDDSAVVSEPTFEEEVIEAQEDDNVTSQIEAPTTKLPEQPKQEEKIISKEEDDKTDEPELFNDDTEEEDEVDETKEEEEEEYEIPFDYLSLKEKYPLDIWGLIDTYFRDNEYYKSKHQLDSFNEFIYSKTNGIEYIIKRENPLIIYKEPISDGTKFKYEISIYFGERFDKDGNKFSDNNIFLSTPSIYDSNDKEMSYMFPNDARLRSLTYAMYIFCNIGITFKIDGKEKLNYKTYEKINIGILPIMVHSKPCLLNGLESQKLTELGECPYDQGGYFIIKGKEKVILSQEKKVNNILYITKSSDGGLTWRNPVDVTPHDVWAGMQECVFGAMHQIVDDKIRIIYQKDFQPGLAVRGDEDMVDMNDIVYLEIDTVGLFDATPLSNNNLDKEFEFNIYPNPANNITTIQISSKINERARISIVDMLGKTVYSTEKDLLVGLNTENINTSKLKTGIYFVNTLCENKKISKKLVITR